MKQLLNCSIHKQTKKFTSSVSLPSPTLAGIHECFEEYGQDRLHKLCSVIPVSATLDEVKKCTGLDKIFEYFRKAPWLT